MSDARLARRAPAFIEASHQRWVAAHRDEPTATPFASRGWTAPGRLVTVTCAVDGLPVRVDGGSAPLPLAAGPPGAGQAGPWGAAVAAPGAESGLPAVFAGLAGLAALPDPPALVAVHGGTQLTRTLVCEQARLKEGIPALVVAPLGLAADDRSFLDYAVTTLVSGRADLIGSPA
jgi:anthraniloyl-CoA monooxygenase